MPTWQRFATLCQHSRKPASRQSPRKHWIFTLILMATRAAPIGRREHDESGRHAAGLAGDDFLQRGDPGGAADSEPVARGQARAARLSEVAHRLRLHRKHPSGAVASTSATYRPDARIHGAKPYTP